MAFHVGQKVVYVGGLNVDPDDPDVPTKDQIYTVSWIGLIEKYNSINIDLVELPNPETPQMYRGYDQLAFRPIVERKTDISIFTAMLTDKREPAHA